MISIIITAWKEEKTIERAISSILKNKIKDKCEVIVIAPDKETLEVAKDFSKKYKEIEVIQDKGKGKPAALNQAFKIAKGDILVLTDGDVYVSENALSNLLKPFEDKKTGGVSGRPVSINSRKNKLGFWSHLLTDIADKRRKKASQTGKKFYCSGYLYAIRAGIVSKVPEETLSEDGFISYLIHSKKYNITYAPNAEVYVKFPTNLKDWIAQKKRSAGGYNQIKNWTKKEIRSFSKESLGIFQVLQYPNSFKEFFWTIELIFMRVYLWILIFKDINLKKQKLKTIWKRIESTK